MRIASVRHRVRAPNTVRAYRADWADFTAWAESHSLQPLPAGLETVARYIAELVARGRKASTIQRRLSAISQAHDAAGHESPARHAAVRALWSGIRRTIGTVPESKAPVLVPELRAMVDVLPHTMAGLRDRALLLLGFAGGLRRSELVALDAEDVEQRREGFVITVRPPAVGRGGVVRKVVIPYGSHLATCPVRAVQAWLERSGIVSGPLFRRVTRGGRPQPGRLSDRAVALIVKRAAARGGLDPARYAGHSLRSGLAVTAAAAGASADNAFAVVGL